MRQTMATGRPLGKPDFLFVDPVLIAENLFEFVEHHRAPG